MKQFAVLVMAAFLTGCAHTANYRPQYVSDQLVLVRPTLEGAALVVTEPAEDQRVYSAHPSSWTGAALTFEATLGEFLRDMTVDVLSRKFKGPVRHAAQLPTEAAGSYRIVVRPKILHFDHRYNQLKSLGMYVTPEAKIVLFVRLYDAQGRQLLEKTYESDYTSGGGYVVSLKPAERINRAVHRNLFDLILRMANDIEQHLQAHVE